jgi:hypothetical protein
MVEAKIHPFLATNGNWNRFKHMLTLFQICGSTIKPTFGSLLVYYSLTCEDATHLKKHVTFLEVNEVHDTTCENNCVELHYWTSKKTPTLTTLLFILNSLKWTSKIPTPLDLT